MRDSIKLGFSTATGVTLVAAVLTAVMAGPVLEAPTSRLFGSEIVGRHADPFIVIHQFERPRGLSLFTQAATDYAGAALAAITGDGVLAHNLLVLATFPLAALFAYLLAVRLTGSRPAAAFAGLLYAFAPYHLAQSAYHAHGAQTQWLPLYLLALWLSLERFTARRLILLVAGLALVALSNFYYGLMALVLTPVTVLGFWWVQRRQRGASPPGLRSTLLALCLLAVAGLTYVVAVAPEVFTDREKLAFSEDQLALYGALPASYLTAPIEHPILGSWAERIWSQRGHGDVLEQQITLGWGLVLLAVFAVFSYLRDLNEPNGAKKSFAAAAPALVLLATVAFWFSLAPGSQDEPRWLRPSALIYEVLPMFRAYARFGLVVFLATAILAAAGLALLMRSRKGRLPGFFLLGLVLFELIPFPPFRWRDVVPTSAHRYLAAAAGDVRLLDCTPADRLGEQPVFQRFEHPVALLPTGADCGDPDFPAKLAHEGFSHMLVRRPSDLGGWLLARAAPPNTVRVGEFADALLYEVHPPPESGAYLEFVSGFHWREYLDDATYRWMGRSGELALINPANEAIRVAVELELHAFPGPRTLAVLLDGVEVAALTVASTPSRHALPELRLEPGRRRMTLQPASPAVVADSVLHNGDARELSVALWSWTLQSAPHAVSSNGRRQRE